MGCFTFCKISWCSHSQSRDHNSGTWQPVHNYDQFPSTLQSCEHHLQSFLLASPERQWGNLQGRLQVLAACWEDSLSSPRTGWKSSLPSGAQPLCWIVETGLRSQRSEPCFCSLAEVFLSMKSTGKLLNGKIFLAFRTMTFSSFLASFKQMPPFWKLERFIVFRMKTIPPFWRLTRFLTEYFVHWFFNLPRLVKLMNPIALVIVWKAPSPNHVLLSPVLCLMTWAIA